MAAALNEQIAMEGYASQLYLSMSVWCDQEGLKGCHRFLRRQANEERMHMLKIVDYLSTVNTSAVIPAIAMPQGPFSDIKELFEQVYAHEKKVTQSIHALVDLSIQEKDFSTQNFLQWYVAEQREEEDLARSILDSIKLIGSGPQSLYFIDKEVDQINSLAQATENAAKEAE